MSFLLYIGKMNNALGGCETIAIEPEIVPYMLTSEIDELNYWLTANGNKPVISQEESVEKAGLSSNVELTMQKLKDQATTENSFIIGEPQLEMDAWWKGKSLKRQNINAGIVRIHVIGTKRIGKVNCSCANALSTKRKYSKFLSDPQCEHFKLRGNG